MLGEEKFNPVTGKIPTVFFHYAIPDMVGLFAVSSAGIVDALFIGTLVGADALATVTLVLPLLSFFIGIGMMVGAGGSVASGKLIGEGNWEQSDNIFSASILVNFTIGGTFLLLCWFLIDVLMMVLAGSNASVRPYLQDYLSIMLLYIPLILVQMTLFYFVRLGGAPRWAAVSSIGGAVTNILLDWLFISKMEMGIHGAAYATVLSGVFACIILLPYFFTPNCPFRFSLPRIKMGRLVKVYSNGLSEFADESTIAITFFIANWVMLERLGADGVASLAVINAIITVGYMLSFGMADTLQPLISQNYGAKRPDRISELLKVCAAGLALIGVIMMGIIIMFPKILVSLFLTDDARLVAAVSLDFLFFVWPIFIFMGFNLLFSAYLTSMHKPLESASISISRSLLLPVAFLLLLPIWFDLIGIYVALPLAEACTCLFGAWLFLRNRPERILCSSKQTAG